MTESANEKVRLYVFVGAYGSGKSEVSVHFAHKLKKEDPSAKVMLADLDIVNPYYRSADAKDALEAEGIRVIVPEYANTNVDVPALSGEVYSAFDMPDTVAVFDIGGEDLGARVLGAMLSRFQNIEYRVYMVVNAFRPFTSDAESIRQMAAELSEAARLPISGFINNSNLLEETTEDELIEGEQVLLSAQELTGIPVVYQTGLDHVLPDSWRDVTPSGIPILRMDRKVLYKY
ncbi:MAG: hypothetical protein J5379_02785 [Clostridiales bacterium]|nr:hypothetical protein [Clostridiales bacterium]